MSTLADWTCLDGAYRRASRPSHKLLVSDWVEPGKGG